MEAFTTHKGSGLPIDIPNCDTDQIVPARFLRRNRTDDGYEKFLFHDLRFNEDGSERAEFIYNKEPYSSASVLVADTNWGCGSSREQAVYVLVANGFRAVIAPSFGDIHYSNCVKQGVLPVRLADEDCDRLRQQLHEEPGAEIALDLAEQTVTGPDGRVYGFEVDPFHKHQLLNGVDDIGLTLGHEDEIAAFEARHRESYRWV